MPAAVEITLTEVGDEPALKAATDAITAFNEPFTGPHGFGAVNLVVRRAGEAAPAGGLFAHTLYRWLFIRLLWLPEDLRRGGLGRQLLARAEAEAQRRGCIGIHLDTFSFQARPFYEKCGFRCFGTLADQPPGQHRYFMHKRLDGVDAATPDGVGPATRPDDAGQEGLDVPT
jgi:GNAT superfamily N-acetyltransferase